MLRTTSESTTASLLPTGAIIIYGFSAAKKGEACGYSGHTIKTAESNFNLKPLL